MPWRRREGISLFYEDAGSGEPPLILVHGWCCDHTFMAPQLAHFRSAHRVIAVDLRGHGQSDKPQQSYTIPTFADDLAWLCRALCLERPVVIGHSMGGAIALEWAAQEPEQLAAIAVLDTAVLPAPDVWTGVQPLLARLRTPDYREAVQQFLADAFFLPTDNPERKAWITAGMLTTPQHVLASALEGIFAWDAATAMVRCRVPSLYIASTRPRGDIARIRQVWPHVVQGQVVSSGHFMQLEVPDQVHAMIRRFLCVHLRHARGTVPTTPDGFR